MVANVPAGTKVVIEPVVPDALGERHRARAQGHRQRRALEQVADLALAPRADGTPRKSGLGPIVKLEDYERTLFPGPRAPTSAAATAPCSPARPSTGARWPSREAVPQALALLRRAAGAARPRRLRRAPARAEAFSFDSSFNSYPLAFERPGPEIVIYRLTGGACGGR